MAEASRVEKHPICGKEVIAEIVRATRPGDFEYRFQASIVRYYEPATGDTHVCRLAPRRLMYQAAEPLPESEPHETPPPPPAPYARQERREVRAAPVAPSLIERYSGGLDE